MRNDSQEGKDALSQVRNFRSMLGLFEEKLESLDKDMNAIDEIHHGLNNLEATYQRHFEAIKADFDKLDDKMDHTIDGLNDLKGDYTAFEKELAIIKQKKKVNFIEKPVI